MKDHLKTLVALFLGLAARGVLRKYQPGIVMVTGSVGKTSTKDAVATVLSKRFLVRKSDKSFNSEFGVPFTILDVPNPWGNPLAWLALIKQSLALLLLPNHYPNMLVLEVGADKPGDLARILRNVTPDVVVVTRLPDIPVHVEAYPSPEAVQEEEFSPAYALHAAAPLIIPSDKPHLRVMAARTPARVITYGADKDADVRLSRCAFLKERQQITGMTAHVATPEGKGSLKVLGSIGNVQLYPVTAAVAVARAFDIPLAETLSSLEGYMPPPGRGRLFAGINGSILIDDSYNSSPVAVEEALTTLKALPNATRRIAVLGDMLELGRYSVQEHERIGKIAKDSVDLLVTVGVRARAMANAAGKTSVLSFDTADAAARGLLDVVTEGSVVLIKGSQSIRTEKVVEALLKDSADVVRLVRQEPQWKKRT